jgi:serine/threonine protein kinase
MAANLPASEYIGQVLQARYQIERQLGQKTGRRTFLATDLQQQRSVVIKLLMFNNEFVWDDLKLFEREAETLKSLDHPAIPKYIDYFDFDLPNLKGFALVQTYIAAPSLEEAFSNGRRFTEPELRELASSLLNILDYLHRLLPPVIHRDIKPSNILISDRTGNSVGTVYLVDFGSVQNAAAKDGGTVTVVGTYGYMPIEQFGGQASPASDLYSLGATMIYLVAGVHPARLPQKDGKIEIPANQFSSNWRKWLQAMTEPSLERRLLNVSTARRSLETALIEPQPILYQSVAPVMRLPGDCTTITKSHQMMEIVALDPRCPINWWLAIILSLFVIPIPLQVLGLATSGLLALSSSWIVLALQFSPVIYNLWHRYYGKTLLSLDRQRITSQYLLGNMPLGVTAGSPLVNIKKISYYPKSYTYQPGSLPQPALMEQIIITADNHQYKIVSNSPAESELLLQELSDWTGIPITRH